MSDEIPKWALNRAMNLTDAEPKPYGYSTYAIAAFARYIMQHEEPPVDSDVLAVRAILASQYDEVTENHGGYIQGYHDDMPHFQDALAAYRKHKQ